MINKKQLALSLFIGAGLILIKLIKLALASPNDMQLQTVSSLFSMGMWYVPLLFVLLYYFVYSSICYLVLRIITYTLNNVLHKWSEAWNKLNAEQRRSICDWLRPAFLILITFLSNATLRIACSLNVQDWLTGKTMAMAARTPVQTKTTPFYRILSTPAVKSSARGPQSRQKTDCSNEFCLLPHQNPAPADHKIDKKRTVLPNFVYYRI